MLQTDVRNFHRLFIGIKYFEIFSSGAERSKHRIKRKCIGAEGKVAIAELLFLTIAQQ